MKGNAALRRCWRHSAPLTAAALLMMLALIASCAGIFLDPRRITGVPAWLKPAKFALSTAIFCGTLAWLFRYMTIWPGLMRAIGWTVAAALVIEVAIIDLQAARGMTSHFNVATPLDAVLFGIMGVSIAILWLASVAVLCALFQQKFDNPAWGWWLRLGMLTTVLGSAGGGLMVRATPAQAETLRATGVARTIGGHSVGAPDGGPGLPGLGWSTRHGDLRIPHFFGLHGLQINAVAGWFAVRRRWIQSSRAQARLAFVFSGSYLGFIGILAWQALRGQSIIRPDSKTLIAFTIWIGATIAAAIFARLLRREDVPPGAASSPGFLAPA